MGVGGLVVLAAAAFATLSLIHSPAYMARWALWQEADVGDHARFPARTVAAAAVPFRFEAAADPTAAAEAVCDALEASGEFIATEHVA